MRIKIFSSTIRVAELESQIKNWEEGEYITAMSVTVTAVVLHDYFQNSAPPMLCNQWIEYLATIVY